MLFQPRLDRLSAFLVGLFLLASCHSGGDGSSSTASGSASGVVAANFSPSSGAIGSFVLITGQNFSSNATENVVRFGGKTGTPAFVDVATVRTILTRVPVGAKAGPIYVSSPQGESLTQASFTLVPQIMQLLPSAAAVGELLEIQGSGFEETLANNLVTIHGVSASVVDGDGSKLIVIVPVGATTGDVVVGTSAGSVSMGPLTVLPSITGLNPGFGFPGNTVTIAGFNFRSTLTDNLVFFNGLAAQVMGADYFGVTVLAPAGLTSGPVTVTTPDGIALGPDFYLPQTPSIAGIVPGSGIPGASVTITGQNFIPGATTVRFHGVPAASVSHVTSTSLQAVVPAGATTGPVEVSHPFASALSSSDFVVLLPPAISGIAPTIGSPGTSVRITGTNFDPAASGNTVSFAGGAVAAVLQASATALDVTVPQGAASGPISLTTAAGSAVSASSFRIAYPRFFVAANRAENTISVYGTDPNTGEFRPKGYAFTGPGTAPHSVSVTPDSRFAYASLEGTNEIAVFALSPNGLLTAVQTLAHGQTPAGLGMHPSGSHLFVANPAANTLSVYSIASSGTLASLGSAATGFKPVAVTVHPSGQFVYATCLFDGPGGNNVSSFSVNALGSLAPVERKRTGAAPIDFQIHPNGLFAFAVNSLDSTVQTFAIASDGKLSSLSAVATGPAGSNPSSFSLDPAGRFAFVANRTTNDVLSYQVNSTTGELAIVGALTQTGGQAPSAVVSDFSGNLYVTNESTNDLSLFSIDPGTGALTFRNTTRMRQGPKALVRVDAESKVVVTPRFAYAPNSLNSAQGNSVSSFRVAGTGSLTGVGSTAAGTSPSSVIADPFGQFVYAGNFSAAIGTAFLSLYRIDTVNQGALIAHGSVTSGQSGVAIGGAAGLTVDPSGRFFYAGNFGTLSGDGAVSAFWIDRSQQGAGNLVPIVGSPYTPHQNATAVPALAVNPSGQLLYALSFQPQKRIVTYTIDPADGALTELDFRPIQQTASQASLIAVHPNGQFLYVVDLNTTTHRVVVFSTLANGAVDTSIGNAATGSNPSGIAFHPNGKFLYVSNQNADTVSAFSVDAVTGLLTRLDADPLSAGIQDFAAGDAPRGLSVDPSGQFLYVANSGNAVPSPNSISGYAIAPNGMLTLVSVLGLPTRAPADVAVVAEHQ